MRVRRSITELSENELDEFSDFESETLARLLDWDEENSIDKDELIKLYVTGLRFMSKLLRFEM